MARTPRRTFQNPMHPAPTRAIPASVATRRSSSRTPSACALPKTTAPRAPTFAAAVSWSTSRASPTPSRTRSGASSRALRSGTQGRPATSAYDGLTRWTRSSPGDRIASVTIRRPRLPGRALAPTSATLRASRVRARASLKRPSSARTPAESLPDRLLVADRGLGRLPSGDAADTAAAVRGGAGVVEAGDRGAVVGVPRRGAHVEQLLGRQLAVEDVAADEPVLLLHLVRADDVAVG